jgi:hypothetical protein
MDNKKPTPIFQQRAIKKCPVCGEPSYSRDGIHPQCAIQQADEPRRVKLAAIKKKKDEQKKPAAKPWSKTCPKCHTEVHVRQLSCGCGHCFSG